ncbi:Agenet domain-containing protein [Cephalotus follicularis]|uniref:Agenet domain-containing protein n=1 Tax=Cephalotus follicularis TaxID=3775 RepID=A0A1Q3BYA3_CEPFO|nr:Agenet domain-containing protein [Cephalotus follicularis]
MDYDDNDFQSQNLHLAGEGNPKFPPVLRPYALPKFDFDDSLHGHLRFDSLVETEVFLGIEGGEDNHWIEDFSRGSSGIQFSSSAAESCSIPGRNNVWSEAASSESVEMLLKSVGQDEIVPGKAIIKGSDACDELGCIIKQMEPSLKHDDDSLSKVGDATDLQSTLPLDEISVETFGLKDVEGKLPHVEDISLTHEGDSTDSGSNKGREDYYASGMQVDSVVTSVQYISKSRGDVLHQVNDTGDEQLDGLQTYIAESGEECHVDQVDQTKDKNLDGNEIGIDNHHFENPLYSAVKIISNKEDNMVETSIDNVEEPPKMILEGVNSKINAESSECVEVFKDLEIGDNCKINLQEVSSVAIEGDSCSGRHEVEISNIGAETFASLESEMGPGTQMSSGLVGCTEKDMLERCCQLDSTIIVNKSEDSVSFSVVAESTEICEANPVSLLSDVRKSDRNVCVDEKGSTELPFECSHVNSEDVGSIVEDKVVQSTLFGEGSSENDLAVSQFQSDATGVNKLASVVTVEKASLASFDTIDGAPLPFGNDGTRNADADHQDVQKSPLSALCLTTLEEKGEIANVIPPEASTTDLNTSSLVTSGISPAFKFVKGETCDTAGQILCDKLVSELDISNAERESEPDLSLNNKVWQECRKEKEVAPIVSDSLGRQSNCAEACVIFEKNEEVVSIKEDYEKVSSEVSDAEPISKDAELVPQPLKDFGCDTSQKGQESNETMSIAVHDNSGQNATETIDVDAQKNREGSFSSALESGCGSADLDKPTCGSPTIIRSTEISPESEKGRVKGSTRKTVSVSGFTDRDACKDQSIYKDPKGIDMSKGSDSFTFEVSSLAVSSVTETVKNWQSFASMQASKVSPIVEGSPSTPCLGQLDPNTLLDTSHGSIQVSGREAVRGKASSDRKPRRTSAKAAGKESSKKGNSVKDLTPMIVRQSEKSDKTSIVSLSPSGICQLVQSNEMQLSSLKPIGVLTPSTSSLPDLNSSVSSSALFQQPFTDLQQVQLRAQIFVYGALIQGTPPDEAYMISAFGGLDGGRSIWENAWRACIERLHGQKSHIASPETPLQQRSGARATDQAVKQSAILSKVTSTVGRASSKGTPSTAANSVVPLSSPLWSTPSGDVLQSIAMPRGPVMDYQQAFSPLHPHQTPPIRNFVGHNTSWISQAPFQGQWVASPQTSAFDASAHFPRLPITETVKLTPLKEPSVPHSTGVKHVAPTPIVQMGSPANVCAGTSPLLDMKKVTGSPGQQSTDPKPRKRKKTLVSEDQGRMILHSQPELVSDPAVTSNVFTSVAISTPAGLVSKASTEKFIISVSPTISSENFNKGDQDSEHTANLSEETIGKLKEAKITAEGAAAFAATAINHSQEVWTLMDNQKNSGLVPDVETKLASAAVAIAAAAAVAKAAAAAANVASNAALQAKLMADEALISCVYGNMEKATPASVFKGEEAASSSSSIILAAREAARKRVEAASAASKRAENMDAIVKAAELAAEAVSQAGIIVAMGDPLPLSELVKAGPEGYWKPQVPQVLFEPVVKLDGVNGGKSNIDSTVEGQDTSTKHSRAVSSDKKEAQTTDHGRSSFSREFSRDSVEDHMRLVDGISGSVAASGKDKKGQKGYKAFDLAKIISETETLPKSSIPVQIEHEMAVESLKGSNIKEGSLVEVFKDGGGFKAAWFTASVLSLKDGKAYVCYSELESDEGLEKLKEWVTLEGEGDRPPIVRIARPITAMPFEGTRKRRRAARGDYTWSVGDRVDAWIRDSWWEGVITEKSKKDETMLTVHFPAQGEKAVVKAWHLRPSLFWKDGEWIGWSISKGNDISSHEGDSPPEKRPRLVSPAVEAKSQDKNTDVDFRKPDDLKLLDLSTNEKSFNVGKTTKENKPGAHRMIRTGLQREGSKVVFGVPKPGKKRKFMEVSKHYQTRKINETNDSVKFTKYLMPQGSGSRGWKNAAHSEPKEKRVVVNKTKVAKSGRPQSVSSRTIPCKENFPSASVSAPGDDTVTDHMTNTKDSLSQVESTSGKHSMTEFQSFPSSGEAAEGQLIFSSMALTSDAPSKRFSNSKSDRANKGKLAPVGRKLARIEEEKFFNGNSAKSTSEVVEPRRSNRRIQPTSRLLEGLQSSLIVSKIPSLSHDKGHRNQSRSTFRGNNHG